jgi:diguanylate cyclase (GGDEF)-like protein/PAS domain S-box-containing protein
MIDEALPNERRAEMSKPLRLLIVEDSEEDATLLIRYLERGGYALVSERVETSTAMSTALRRGTWDLVISDFTMPHFSATDALTLLQKTENDIPFIIVSGSIGEDTAVAAMKAGAHDYIMKNNLSRLIPAIERELRDVGIRRDRKEVENQLRESIERFQIITRATNDTIWDWDLVTNYLWWNENVSKLFRYSADKVGSGVAWWIERLHPEDREKTLSNVHGVIDNGGQFWSGEYRFLRGDGSYADVFNRGYVVRDPNGKPLRMLGAMMDITERKRAEEMIKHMAYYDTLTDLPNRTLLHDRLQQAILDGEGEKKPMALLLMDLNRFKEVNETLGHHHGDFLLQQVGPRLRGVLPESSIIARLGGDEFAILLPGTGMDKAMETARRILKALEEPFVLGVLTIDMGASIGIALWPDHGEDAYTLLQRADIAMYMAKQSHNGCAVYATEHDQTSPRRLALMGELRHAIDDNQLFPLFQPKISLQTKRAMGVETLVRWQHPNFGVIPPDQFIPLAEQTGLIKALTIWVLTAALRQCRHWLEAGLEFPVAVNLSVRNLLDPQLPSQVGEILKACGVAPRFLELEITESTIMADPAHAMEVLTELRKMGIGLSIDDFGTGYSSLGYLKKLAVDEIKIDKSFVKEMAHNEDDTAIVRSTIDLAHNLGLRVVAEGVEDQETLNRLIALGCDAAQGYYISRPVVGPELTRWMSDSPWGLKFLPPKDPSR